MRPICADFDDFFDGTVSELQTLASVKRRTPGFKCTLYTIPTRTSSGTIDAAKRWNDIAKEEWIQLAPHGWRHTKGECLGWTDEEAAEKIRLAAKMGIDAPIFRAPGWLLDADVYTACGKLDYAVASHKLFRIAKTGVPEYIYNYRFPGHRNISATHGHLTNADSSTDYIGTLLEHGSLDYKEDAKFVWPQDIAKVFDEDTIDS